MTENVTEATAGQVGAVEPASARGTFADLGLRPEVLRALEDMGFTAPMEVQRQTAPVVMSGRDVLVQSRTGSGKTAAFGIPLIDRMVEPNEKAVQAIVLLPTRELALQVAAEMARIAAHRELTVVPVYGGAPMGRQVEQLRAGGQIVCGTPGRILDHLRRGTLKLDRVRCAVLDECDEMLSMGFQEDIERILEHTPTTRQTMLFSATLPEAIKRLARRYLRDPAHLKLSADFVGVAEISHLYYAVNGANRESDLLRILAFENPGRGIVFCNTREETGRVAEFLRSKGMEAEAISSDLSQSDREKVMKRMREGSIRFLVATDVAARGIDIDDISHVFNFSFPDSPESYIHRTGRTGRAGRHGVAVSLIGPTEVGSFYYLKLLYKIKPEERTLPSEGEIQARREGESITALRKQLQAEPGPQWRALARRVMTGLDSEHLIAALLKERLSKARPVEPVKERVAADESAGGAPEPVHTRSERPRGERDRGERERGNFRDRGERPRSRYERGERAPRREQDQDPVTAEALLEQQAASASVMQAPVAPRPPVVTSAPQAPPVVAPAPVAARAESTNAPTTAPADLGADDRYARRSRPDRFRDGERRPERDGGERRPERDRGDRSDRGERPRPAVASEARPARQADDFAAVWQDDGSAPRGEVPRTATPAQDEASGARLYLNLGRKDRVRSDDVVALLESAGVRLSRDAVEVMNTHSYINVEEGRAQALVEALNGREHNGRSLVCEVAKPRRERF
ncbi:MAG: DEAD/DEAH box helicase [Deltaproteobacteria bacterium]|nr:DEAD/DEAH box helicase [Deltaproteobacteria bacterium]